MNIFAAVAFIQKKDGTILATSRRGQPKAWGLPGGKLEQGEDPFAALQREVKEETGLEVKKGAVVYERPTEDGHVLCYRITHVKGSAEQQDDEIEVDWVYPRDLMNGAFGEYNTGLLKKLGIINDKLSYHVYWSADDNDFVGTCDEYPSLTALGNTPDAAWEGITRLVKELGGLDA